MNNKLNKIFKYLCTFIMVIPISACNNKIVDEENDNPDTSGTHVYFGSYPQSEVVSNASDSGVYNKAWSNENDYIIDANLYNNLATLSEEN